MRFELFVHRGILLWVWFAEMKPLRHLGKAWLDARGIAGFARFYVKRNPGLYSRTSCAVSKCFSKCFGERARSMFPVSVQTWRKHFGVYLS